MPLVVLSAIFVAFWFPPTETAPFSAATRQVRLLACAGGLLGIAAIAAGLGRWVTGRVARRGYATPVVRSVFLWGGRALEALTLILFALNVHLFGWARVVGRWDVPLVERSLILAPFLLAELAVWVALYRAERALALSRLGESGLGRHLALKARQAYGLVLPVAVVFCLVQDGIDRFWPDEAPEPWIELMLMGATGGAVLVFAPALVRLSWPTHPLPAGPLRDRLDRLAGRYGFRYTDILVWDTGGALVNAGVTGAVPWFRYVLLTDALIECLDERQVEAVFGHEVGHIAHRHLAFFGFFFLGSMGLLALGVEGIRGVFRAGSPWVGGLTDATAVDTTQAGVALLAAGAYFLLVFGFLSRRFERQADVFGCRAVSCGRDGCPPHDDVNARAGRATADDGLCGVGIRTFTGALAQVATLNGMKPTARSWRHGSIRRRIDFLEGLEGRPADERRFQRRLRWSRLAVSGLLALAIGLAVATEAFRNLR